MVVNSLRLPLSLDFTAAFWVLVCSAFLSMLNFLTSATSTLTSRSSNAFCLPCHLCGCSLIFSFATFLRTTPNSFQMESFRGTSVASEPQQQETPSAGLYTRLDCLWLVCLYCVVDTHAAWVLAGPLSPTYGRWVMYSLPMIEHPSLMSYISVRL